MMYMIRKQLYITEEQEFRLKRQAQQLGVSEAELMRRALDLALGSEVPVLPESMRRAAVKALLDDADQIVKDLQPTLPGGLHRDDTYEEREAKLLPR